MRVTETLRTDYLHRTDGGTAGAMREGQGGDGVSCSVVCCVHASPSVHSIDAFRHDQEPNQDRFVAMPALFAVCVVL